MYDLSRYTWEVSIAIHIIYTGSPSYKKLQTPQATMKSSIMNRLPVIPVWNIHILKRKQQV